MKKPGNKPASGKLRRKVEELMKRNPLEPVSPGSEADVLKLVHEIEVYKIELELRNKELLAAKVMSEESELRMKLALDASKAGTWDWDIEAGTFHWSDEFLKIFGMPKGTRAGFEEWKKALHPEDVEIASGRIQESIDNQTDLQNDYRIVLPGNVIRWIRSTGKTFYISGKPTRMIGLCMDVTTQKEIELELIKARNMAEESDRLKTAFLNNISHEIRTPMNGILGFAELLKEPHLSDEEQSQYIRIIEKSGARLLNTINDIVEISKVVSDEVKVVISDIDLRSKMDDVYIAYRAEAEAKGLQFRVHCNVSPGEVTLRTDKYKLWSILYYLIRNAMKFTRTGYVECGCSLNREHIEFFVKDTGIGIPAELRQVIFESFRHTDESPNRDYEGTGLGLSISRAYVEAMGGTMWVESTEGIGSTFYFTVPYMRLADGQVPAGQGRSVIEQKDLRNLKLLLAEDDESTIQYISLVLGKLDCQIITVRAGAEAVQACRDHPDIDLVLMDLKLPDMNGYEAARQIRTLNDKVIIIAQTAYDLQTDSELSREACFNASINKPFTREELTEMIKRYVPGKK
jgi:signal transduction histidine kinase